jgi:hypothetical protein
VAAQRGTSPDFRLQLVRDPAMWFDAVSLALLAELSRHVPELRDLIRPTALWPKLRP